VGNAWITRGIFRLPINSATSTICASFWAPEVEELGAICR